MYYIHHKLEASKVFNRIRCDYFSTEDEKMIKLAIRVKRDKKLQKMPDLLRKFKIYDIN